MKSPAVLFYTSDFLTGTMLFTDEQVGKYIRLLCLQHQVGHLSEDDMLRVCGSHDPRMWSKFEKTADGRYHNLRMHYEIQKREKYTSSRTKNINQRWKKSRKSLKNKEINTHTSVLHMEDEDEDEDLLNLNLEKEGCKGENKQSQIEAIYHAYPRHIGRGQAVKAIAGAIKKVSYDVLLAAVQRFALECELKEPRYIPHPATWMNGERWADEPDRTLTPEQLKLATDPEAQANRARLIEQGII